MLEDEEDEPARIAPEAAAAVADAAVAVASNRPPSDTMALSVPAH